MQELRNKKGHRKSPEHDTRKNTHKTTGGPDSIPGTGYRYQTGQQVDIRQHPGLSGARTSHKHRQYRSSRETCQ